MAYIHHIHLHTGEVGRDFMTVYVRLKPKGSVSLKVPVPVEFMDCLLRMAQHAADKHEQEMRAQILADAAKPPAAEVK